MMSNELRERIYSLLDMARKVYKEDDDLLFNEGIQELSEVTEKLIKDIQE